MTQISRFLFAMVAALGLLLGAAVPAHGEVFDTWVQHPSIAAQPESGRIIFDLAVSGGELYMGYGDYTANTGPIDVATANLTTGATGVKASVPTEAIDVYRTFGGALYAPWVDPKGSGGLYTSNRSSVWAHYGTTVPSEHVYDVAVLPNGAVLAVGAARSGGAAAWVSRDNGATWILAKTDLRSNSGFERYYWIMMIGGKAYIQARDMYAQEGKTAYPLRIFDGVQWSQQKRRVTDCFANAHAVESFGGKAYCGNGRVFDGRSSVTTGGIVATDFYQFNGTLYALSSDRVMRLENGVWVQDAVFLSGSRGHSIAVTATHYYVGDESGRVSRYAY